MIYAELRREERGEGYYTLRYIVYNGDIVGSYGVFFSPTGPFGGTRDYHRLASITDYNRDSFVQPQSCEFHDDKPSICDGSSMVEHIVDNDQRAFELAAMMAEVTR